MFADTHCITRIGESLIAAALPFMVRAG
jgi:hypothetical protein